MSGRVKFRFEAQRKPARRPLRLNAGLVVGAVAAIGFLAALGATPRWGQTEDMSRQLSAEHGYKAAVDTLAAKGFFKIRTLRAARTGSRARQQVELVSRAVDQAGESLGDCRRWHEKLLPGGGDRCAERITEYRDLTFLGEDMLLIDQWRVRDGAVDTLRPEARVLLPSGGRRRAWTGVIHYRPEPRDRGGAYRPGEATLMLSEVGSNRPVFRFLDGVGPASPGLDKVVRDDAWSGEGRQLRVSLAGRRSDAAQTGSPVTFTRLGRAVLVSLPVRMNGLRVYIDGRRADRDRGENSLRDNDDFVLVRPGQYLALEDASGRRRTLQLVETPAAISEYGAGGRRLREGSLHDVARWLEQADVDGNYTSSIVATLHHDLQRRLAEAMTENAGGPPPQSYRGAVLMIDGLTGEIAAAATFPTRVDQLAPRDRDNPARIEWLKTNFNFQPLVAGSTAKVPFAAAILERWPALANMTLDYQPSFSSIGAGRERFELRPLDGKLRTMTNTRPGDGSRSVTFTRFIADSNNEYALTLMMKATALEKAGNPSGSWRTRQAWPANLWRFGCVIPYSPRGSGRYDGWEAVPPSCSPYLWRDELDRPYGKRPTPGGSTRLRMGLINNLYTDFYLDIIGGNRSVWTTADLGQAYARILSGRAMTPRLALTGPATEFETVSVKPTTWTPITKGMRQVLVDGTAKDVGAALAPPPGVFFFAKTGTSDVEFPNGKTEEGHLLVLAAARTRSGGPPTGPADICALKLIVINLQRDASNAKALAKRLLDPAAGAGYRAWMTQPCPVETP